MDTVSFRGSTTGSWEQIEPWVARWVVYYAKMSEGRWDWQDLYQEVWIRLHRRTIKIGYESLAVRRAIVSTIREGNGRLGAAKNPWPRVLEGMPEELTGKDAPVGWELEQMELFEQATEGLAPRDKQAVELTCFDGLNRREVGERLGITGQSTSNIFRKMRKLSTRRIAEAQGKLNARP